MNRRHPHRHLARCPSFAFLATFIALTCASATAQNVYTNAGGVQLKNRFNVPQNEVLQGEPIQLSAIVFIDSPAGFSVENPTSTGQDTALATFSFAAFFQSTGKEVTQNVVRNNVSSGFSNLPERNGTIFKQAHVFSQWFEFQEPGTYRLMVLRHPKPGPVEPQPEIAMEATIEVLPPDDEKMGIVIEEFGQRALKSPGESLSDFEVLGWINDRRTIPFFIQRINTLLERANDRALRSTYPTPPSNSPEPTEPTRPMLFVRFGLIDTTESEIARLCAVLARYDDGEARSTLIKVTQSPNECVRYNLAVHFANVTSPEALRTLEQLLHDQSEDVRIAAQRSLDARKANNPQ